MQVIIRIVNNTTIRLQKFLADRGIASRRHAVSYITSGRVKVNGTPALEPGTRIDPAKDKVTLDDRPLERGREPLRTIMLHKPREYICSTSSIQGPTVYELISGIKERLVPIGRLDKNTEGLLLMSNDGDLINHLTHPRFEQDKTYKATVSGKVDNTVLKTLRSPMSLGYDRPIRPAVVRLISNNSKIDRSVLEFILKEGRKRQIRLMCEQVDLKVHRLIRTKVKTLSLTGLQQGKWRDLTKHELDILRKK